MANRDPWLDRYREGSFRGISFKTKSHSVTGGRRKQDREFARREIGNSEDLGKKLKKFTLELYVVGSDYFDSRDALENALDTEGPGELIHPYRGTLQVQAGGFTLTETDDEGRIARFSVEFTEAGEVKFPDQVEDETAKVVTTADDVIENSKGFFANVFDTINEAAFVIQSAADDVAALVDSIESAINSVTEPVANLTFAISNLKADINDLIKLPGELADRIAAVFDDLLAEFENDPDTSNRILGNFDNNLDTAFEPIIGDTPSRETQKGNQTATSNLGRELGFSNRSKAAVDVEYTSVKSAKETRDEIVEGLNTQLFNIEDDELFQSVKEMQTSLTKALPIVGTTELINFIPPKTLPALVISYNLFGDINKEDEIIDQNKVEHPGFVPGGDSIEVSAG